MQTLVTDSASVAAEFIRRGELVGFPTETVYGLGADANNRDAVRRLYEVKGRPSDNPLIVHLSSVEMISSIVERLGPAASALVDAFFPGPLTLIGRRSKLVPKEVTAGLDTVAFRMPSLAISQAFLKACNCPVAAPSANRSGRPSATTWQAVMEDLEGRIGCVLRGERSLVGLESSVVDCTTVVPQVLREGAISVEELRRITRVECYQHVNGAEPVSRSPGLRHRHYAPTATVTVYKPGRGQVPPRSAYIGLEKPLRPDEFERCLVCTGVAQYAHELYHFFRECDKTGISHIYCGQVPPVGIGAALSDRIDRASRR